MRPSAARVYLCVVQLAVQVESDAVLVNHTQGGDIRHHLFLLHQVLNQIPGPCAYRGTEQGYVQGAAVRETAALGRRLVDGRRASA